MMKQQTNPNIFQPDEATRGSLVVIAHGNHGGSKGVPIKVVTRYLAPFPVWIKIKHNSWGKN